MLPHSAFLFLPASQTKWPGLPFAPFGENLASGSRCVSAILGGSAPSRKPPQHLHKLREIALNISCASESDLLGAVTKLDWRNDALEILTSRRASVSSIDYKKFLLQLDAEPAKSIRAQPDGINLVGDSLIKKAMGIHQRDSSSTKNFPKLPSYSFYLEDLWLTHNEGFSTLSAVQNPAGLAVALVVRSKNSISKRTPKGTESTYEVTREGELLPAKNTSHASGIGFFIDQIATRICAEQSSDITSIKSAGVHFGVLGQPDTVAPRPKLSQNFGAQLAECHANFGSASLSSRPTRFISPSISPAKSRTTGNESVRSGAQIALGSASQRPLGWLSQMPNPLPTGHPNEVSRAKFLAKATTISAQTRTKTGCLAHHKPTPTPTKYDHE